MPATWSARRGRWKRRSSASGACAIGEIGLDYHYDFSPREVQQDVFRAQIRLARQRDLPIIIHTREATDDTFAILEEEGGAAIRGVFHCFTGDVAMAQRALAIGFYLSYAGILTFPKAEELREAARVTPIDRLLSETDAPFLAPVPFRGKRNEPAYVTRVVQTLAELHGQSIAPWGSGSRRTSRGSSADEAVRTRPICRLANTPNCKGLAR